MSATDQDSEFRIDFTGDGRASLTGLMTFESVPALFRDLERQEASGAAVESFDLAGLTAADSAGLALMLEWQARARAAGRGLAVRNAPSGLLRLARLCEAVDLLNLSGRDGDGGGE